MNSGIRDDSDKLSSYLSFDLNRTILRTTLYEDLHAFLWISGAQLGKCFQDRNIFWINVIEENEAHISCTRFTVFEITGQCTVSIHFRSCVFNNLNQSGEEQISLRLRFSHIYFTPLAQNNY
jgi:hypothetical protein